MDVLESQVHRVWRGWRNNRNNFITAPRAGTNPQRLANAAYEKTLEMCNWKLLVHFRGFSGRGRAWRRLHFRKTNPEWIFVDRAWFARVELPVSLPFSFLGGVVPTHIWKSMELSNLLLTPSDKGQRTFGWHVAESHRKIDLSEHKKRAPTSERWEIDKYLGDVAFPNPVEGRWSSQQFPLDPPSRPPRAAYDYCSSRL